MSLRQRFDELRAEEQRAIPPFRVPRPRRRRRRRSMRLVPVTAVVLILMTMGAVTFLDRPAPATFTAADLAAARAIASWRPPTQSLLLTPGRELLVSTPAIPSKGLTP